jgi:hypothetical protein
MAQSPRRQSVEKMERGMLSSLFALAMAMQADTTRASREAFTRCLGQFVDASVTARKTADQFRTEYAQACTAEQTAFREAIIRREVGLRSTRASAEETASLEIQDARENFSGRFEMATTPS